MATTETHPNLPLALSANPNVVGFAAVDDSAMVFANMPSEEPVRAQLDEIYANHELDFETARHSSTVDLDTSDEDFDKLFIYS